MKIGLNGRHLVNNSGGVSSYLRNILLEWSVNKVGHTFNIYLNNHDKNKYLKSDWPNRLRGLRINIRSSIVDPASSQIFWYCVTLPHLLKHDNIDFFFSSDYFLPPGILTLPSSMSIHDVSYLAHPEWFPFNYRLYTHYLSKRQVKNTNIILTISNFSKNEILRFTDADEKKIRVIPLAVNKSYTPQRKSEQIPFKPTGKYFLFVGKILNRRFPIEILTGFSNYLTKYSDKTTQLVIRGNNETHPHLPINKIVEGLNKKFGRQTILILPSQDENSLVHLYQHATASIYLSDYEGFGLPILESMACGTPVITTNTSAIPEVAGDAGVYLNPHDTNAIPEQLHRLVSNEGYLRILQQKCLIQAHKFSWSKTASETLNIIEKFDSSL